MYENVDPEKWREIEESRERLRLYKLKCQPYPLDETVSFMPNESKSGGIERQTPSDSLTKQNDMAQLKALVLDLQNRLNKHIDYKKKAPQKKTEGLEL